MFDSRLSLFWQLSWKIVIACLLIFGIGVRFLPPLSWGIGCVVGCVFTIIRLKMMEISVEKSVKMDEKQAVRYARGQYILRYLMSGVVLAAAAILPWIDPIATVLAMLSLKLVTYIQGILDKKFRPEEDYPIVEWEDEEEDEDEEWDRWQTYNRKAGRKLKREMQGGVLKKQAAEPQNGEVRKKVPEIAQTEDETEDMQLSLFDEENNQ